MEISHRRYLTVHSLDGSQRVTAGVSWNGESWIVKVNEDVLPDCCSTIEDAFTAAEREIASRFPGHSCVSCQPWEPHAEA
jgi:hypothetical protein